MLKNKHTTHKNLAGHNPAKAQPLSPNRSRKRFRRAFTLTELVVTMISSIVVLSSFGVILVDSQTSWNKMYNRVNSDVVIDAYVAKKTFNAVVRKSSIKMYDIGNSGEFVRVYYYNNNDPSSSYYSTKLDRFATFYASGRELVVDYGVYNPGSSSISAVLRTVTLARNVQSVIFVAKDVSNSVQMILKLDNGRESLIVTCSAVRHNN